MPERIGVVVEGSILVVVVQAIQLEIQMRDVNVLPAIAVHVRRVDAHSRFVAAVLARRNAGNQRNILKRSIVFVEEKKIRPGVVGDGDVGPAIVVEIGEHHAHALRFRLADAGRVAHVGECSVVIVVVELGFLPFVVARIAVRAVARPALAAPQIILRRPLDIVGDHQVQPAIFVVVKPSCAGRPSAFIGDAGFRGDIGERSIAVIVVKNRAAVSGHIQDRDSRRCRSPRRRRLDRSGPLRPRRPFR